MDKLEFNYNMALILNKQLEQQGVIRSKSLFSKDFYSFTMEELSRIQSLTIENVTDLSYIDLFPNLKKVVIQSVEYTRLDESIDLEGASFTNNIKDFSPIERSKSIEDLTIVNEIHLESLDLSGLNLQNLKIINTPKLTTLKGLEKQKSLKNVLIYGTSIRSEFDIVEYIKNTIQAEVNILDVNMYQSLIKRDEALAQYISEAVTIGETHLRFAELVGLMDFAVIDAKALEEMYKKANLLFRIWGVHNRTDNEKISFIYQYVLKNTIFDKEGLQNRDAEYNNYIEKYNKIPEFAKKKFAMIHSSYSAFMIGKANCEGFINLIKFMLNIVGIRSFNVHCIDVRNNVNELPNHSMIRIMYEGKWYYCDPTIYPEQPGTFFMKTYEEIQMLGRHRLNAFENQINRETNYEQYHAANPGEQFRQ